MIEPKIKICFTTRRSWYSRFIAWITKSKANHTFLMHEDPFWGGWRATEIDSEGPHDKSIKELQPYKYIEYWECNQSLLDGIRQMSEYVGNAKYDWLGLIFGLIRLGILKIFRVRIKESIHSKERLFCSEFVAEVFKRAKLPGTENWVTSDMSPADVRNFMLDNPELFKKE